LQEYPRLNKKLTITFFLALFSATAISQKLFSIATDIGLQRNFKKEQLYWAFGHTTQALFHITAKDGIYIWFAYYSPGHYKNNLVATAKSALTLPQEIAYTNKAKMRLKQFSVGWRKYLRGTPDTEKNWNIYAFGGFGLLLGRVENVHSVLIDTADYNLPVLSGKANFKRLTVDLGAGGEIPIGIDFFLYTEGRVWIPTTNYPSEFIFVNENAPFTGMVSLGLRLLF
jgi:hypothetical protein